MSKNRSYCDEDGFRLVLPKSRKAQKLKNKIQLGELTSLKKIVPIDLTRAKSKILKANQLLYASTYFESFINSVSSRLNNQRVEIVCLGLGHFGECNISRHQLAFILCLKARLKCEKVCVHDPLFYREECILLQELGLDLILENKEGFQPISKNNTTTIAYLPHCPKQLTNNFLWQNWGPEIINCVLICNSFTSVVTLNPTRVLENEVPYISKIHPHTTEIKLENNYIHSDIFNDTSVHLFIPEQLSKVSKDFWTKGDKPTYNNTEEFITSQLIDTLKI